MGVIRVASVLLLVSGCRGTTNTAAVQASPPTAPTTITDGIVDVRAGTSLHIHCVGNGEPVVIFDSGLANDGPVWRGVQLEVGQSTRACVYDRAGLGYSSQPARKPHPNRLMARELYTLLDRAGLRGPYVLVGHSIGGINVRLLASEHLDDVAGMVLVDAVGDEQPSRYWALVPEERMAEFRVGLSKLPEGLDYDTFTPSSIHRAATVTPRTLAHDSIAARCASSPSACSSVLTRREAIAIAGSRCRTVRLFMAEHSYKPSRFIRTTK